MLSIARFLLILCLCAPLWPAPAALAVFGDDDPSGPDSAAEADGETDGETDADAAPILTEIVITGNERTDRTLILREMGLRIGQPLSYDQVDAIWDRLEDIGYFSYVDIEYDDSEPGEVVLNVLVEEDMTLFYGPVVRHSRRHKYLLGGWIAENNFRGKGETLKLEVAALYIQRGEASWRRPWLFGVTGLQADAAVLYEQANFVFRPTRYRTWHADLDLRWNFWSSFFVAAGARYGGFKTRDGYWWDAPVREPDAPAGPLWHEPGNENRLRLRAAVGYDSRDNVWYPLRGVYGEAGLARWQSDDFADYHEFTIDGRAFVPLPWKKHVLALRCWGRRVDGPAQLDNVLFFGGVETIRGYPFGQREGDEGYLLTVEYRLPFFIMPISPQGEMVGFGLHLFCDAGDAWYEGAAPGRRWLGYGGGAHINIDTLQLRFEAARTEDGHWQFEFADRFNF